VTSYAPIQGRSRLLETLMKRASHKEPKFYSSIISGVEAVTAACPWITKEKLAHMKRTQPPHVFKRVFLNKITADDGEHDFYLFSRTQLADITDMGWSVQTKRPPDAVGITVLGVDFGAKHDAAVVTALTRMKDRTIALLDMVAKHGTRKDPLPGNWVIDTVLDMVAKFGRVKIVVDPVGLTDQIVALRTRGFDVVECSHKGPQVTDALWRAVSGRRIRIYSHAGETEIYDGRQYSLDDELRSVMIDNDTRKMFHKGECTEPGRHYDDRVTSIGLALQAPELDLGNTQSITGNTLADAIGAATGAIATGNPHRRVFANAPKKVVPGATFAPVLVSPVSSKFGFRRY
jgi:hypothetical protein